MSWGEAAGLVRELASNGLIAAGIFFILVGSIGVVRLPDFYTRMHSAGMTDTMGAELVFLGLILKAGFTLDAVKLVLLGFFLFLTSPASTHAVANAAYTAGVAPLLGRFRPKRPQDGAGEGEH